MIRAHYIIDRETVEAIARSFWGLRRPLSSAPFHVFTRYVKLTFFKGAALRPPPPGGSKHPEVRYLDVHEGELDEQQLARWVKQAAAIPGWMA